MRLERILCAEDDADVQAVLRLALEDVGGFEARICGSGDELLREVAGFAPDLVLLDVMLPGMDGPGILRRLRGNPASAHLPVVFLTAKAQPAEIEHYRRLGALGAIAKPFDPMRLAAQIRQLALDAGTKPQGENPHTAS